MKIEFDVPDDILQHLLGGVKIPPMALVQHDIVTPPAIQNVAAEVRSQVSAMRGRLQRGQRVGVGVGSRGIGQLADIVTALIAELRDAGTEPFVFPAMGSHGGATGDGQRRVLEHLGVTEDRINAPIISSMDVDEIGRTDNGMPVYVDAAAHGADAIVFVARIKPHTAFRGRYESGLAKMIAIGLGKQAGAAATHAAGFGEMAQMVPAMATIALERLPILFGLAILENAGEEPFRIIAVPAEHIMADEPALLEQARSAMPHLPFGEIDVLVIDRIGKNISGDGADPNITGRYPTPYATGGPVVNKQVVLDLHPASTGNANGVGTADFTTVRLAQKMSFGETYPNALSSTVPGPVALPMVLPSDRLALAAAVLTCNAVGRSPRMVRIADTLHVRTMLVSDALLPEVGRNDRLTVVRASQPLKYDEWGNLVGEIGE